MELRRRADAEHDEPVSRECDHPRDARGTAQAAAGRERLGAKYSDGSLTFWTKGDTATLERQGSAPVQCREARYESLLADARERGVRFRGRGNEPGWTVEIGPGTRLEFVTDYGQERHAFDAASESGSETAGARVFRAEHGSQRIKVSVTTEACTDDMSDERFAQRMTVEFGGRSYRGCATALQ